ncbi:hypothetical protein [Streptomyces sp. NPDC006274]|uniref:phage tail protein n=1 Tax=unclassified Streptomyces TaxID=2593676 RepID=UPI0033B295C1
MALNIGSLVGQIRADDSGWRHGLQEAQLRLAGFTRMADGRLRDMHGRFVTESDAMGQTLGANIREGANRAIAALKKVTPAVLGISAGVPAVAALTTALGGLAAGAVAAGLAVGAFQAAAKPQLALMEESSAAADTLAKAQEDEARKAALAAQLKKEGSDLATKAEKAYTSARLKTKDAEAAYERQTAGMPKATAEAALAQARLKTAHEEWSASLAGTTMPVFTKGLNLLRSLLPTLTPFVKAAAGAFGDMLDRIAVGVKSAGFKEWAADMAAASGTALKNFITVIGNLGKGFMGLMQAFLPASAGVTGGLVSMTGAFADWGTSLKDSEGFAQFLDLAREGAGVLGTLAKAAVQILVAMAPLVGVTAAVAMAAAKLINAIPPDVLAAIGTALGIIVLAVKAYNLYVRIAAAVTRAWAIAQGIFNAVMMLNPVGLVIAAIIALVAIVVIAYQKSETFRDIVQAVWTTLKTWIKTAVDAIAATIGWFADLPDKISGWFQDAKDWAIRKMAEMVVWLTGLPGRVWSAISGLGSKLREAASKGFQKFRDAAARKVVSFIAWVRDMPGRITRAIGNMGSLLYNKGRDIVLGLWNGIKGMGGWLRDTLMGWARDLIPGPIAKALGISSPSRVMAKQVGRWIPAGVVDGIQAGSPAVDKAMSNLATPTSMPRVSAGATSRSSQKAVIEIRGDGSQEADYLVNLLRRRVHVLGGNVQLVLGQGRG